MRTYVQAEAESLRAEVEVLEAAVDAANSFTFDQVRACGRAGVHACVRACVRACLRV